MAPRNLFFFQVKGRMYRRESDVDGLWEEGGGPVAAQGGTFTWHSVVRPL